MDSLMAVHQTHIGTDRQLFVDDYWIADYRGTARKLHNPVRREAAISIDKPWEQGSIGCMTTIQDKGCLLYTSDAADDMQCVDLGGRRII